MRLTKCRPKRSGSDHGGPGLTEEGELACRRTLKKRARQKGKTLTREEFRAALNEDVKGPPYTTPTLEELSGSELYLRDLK